MVTECVKAPCRNANSVQKMCTDLLACKWFELKFEQLIFPPLRLVSKCLQWCCYNSAVVITVHVIVQQSLLTMTKNHFQSHKFHSQKKTVYVLILRSVVL